MTFAGNTKPSCYVEIKSIGSLNPPEISESISKIIERHTKIPSSRIYMGFENVKGSNWGYNKSTFG